MKEITNSTGTEDEGKLESQRQTIKSRLKQQLFEIYFELMKERNIAFGYGSILISIMFLQMFGYIYYRKTNFPFDDDLYEFMASAFDMIRIYPAIENSDSQANYLAFAVASLVLIFIYYIGLLYIGYSIRIGKFHFMLPLMIMKYLNSILYWILLNPIVETLISIFSCSGSYHIILTGTQCWTGIHIFYIILFFFALVAYILIIFLISYFFNESRNTSTDIFARLDCNFEIYLGVYRILNAIIGHFCTSTGLHWVLILLYLVGSLNFVKMYFKYLPYYHSSISIFFGAGLVSYFWFCFNLFISKLLENLDYTGQSIVILVGMVIIYPLVKNLREKKIYNNIFMYKYDKIKNEYELDLYMNKLMELISNQSHKEVDEMILLGFVTNHKSECTRAECPLNHVDELYLPATDTYSNREKSNMRDTIVLLYLMDSIYAIYTKNSNASTILHTIYSNFLFYKIGNIHMALLELNVAEKCETSLQQKFTIYRSKSFIENYLINRYKKKESSKQTFENLDVTIVITFEGIFGKLQKAIEKSASEHIEFWSHLDSLLPDLNQLHSIGLNIIVYSKQCHDLWNKLIKINSRYPKALSIYGYYLIEIKNDKEEGEKKVEEARGFTFNKSLEEHLSDFELMFADDTAIIVMSGNKETQGKIAKTNSGIVPLFGYNTFEIYGHDVNILMPPIIGARHQFYLEKYFRTGQERMMNNESEIFGMKRSGYIFSITLIIKPVPSLKQDIQYIGLIRPYGKEYDYIITDMQGKIDSITDGISGFLNVGASFFKENDVYIQLLCPDLLDLVKDKNGTIVTKLDLLKGNKDLLFKVPLNFTNLAQSMSKNPKLGSTTKVVDDMTAEEDSNSDSDSGSDSQNGSSDFAPKRAKLPEIVKKITAMLKSGSSGKEYEGNRLNQNALKEAIRYNDCEFEKKMRCDIQEQSFGENDLKIKIFKIRKQRKYEVSIQSTVDYKHEFSNSRRPPKQPLKVLSETPIEEEEENSFSASSNESESQNSQNSQRPETNSHSESPSFKIKEIIRPIEEEKVDPSMLPRFGFNPHENLDQTLDNSLNVSNIEGLPLAPGETKGRYPDPDPDPDATKYVSRREISIKKFEDLIPEDELLKNLNVTSNEGEIMKGMEKKVVKKDLDANIEDDVGSVASNTKSFMKFLRSLRSSMYGEYNPRSVKHLKTSAQLVFLALIIITVVYFFIASALYENLKSNIDDLYSSKNRMWSTVAIGGSTRALTLMNPVNPAHPGITLINPGMRLFNYAKIAKGTSAGTMNYYNYTINNIGIMATMLKKSQNSLATSSFTFDDDQSINPSKVNILYSPAPNIPDQFEIDCWSAIMGLVIHSFKVQEMPLPLIQEEEESVAYVLVNSFNNILQSIDKAIDEVLDKSHDTAKGDRRILLILLIVASLAIFFSICVIFPVVTTVRKNKEEMLCLFLEIPMRSIKDQLNKCRKFFNTIRGEPEKITKENDPDFDEDLEDEEDLDMGGKKVESDKLLGNSEKKSSGRKKRKYKPYSTHKLLLIVKFLFFVVILEGYFCLSYFTSDSFLTRTLCLIEEVGIINQRSYSNSLLFYSQQELIGTNGTATVVNIPSYIFVPDFIRSLIKEQEDFLKTHSQNLKYNDEGYKSYFDSLVYKDSCAELYTGDNLIECNEFMGGILMKGLHSANVAFWDNMREFTNDFMQMPPTGKTWGYIMYMLNDPRMLNNEILEVKYFEYAYDQLLLKLDDSIQNKFNSEKNLMLINFILYLIILFILYFFIWRYFVESTRKALWTTKSMLSIIPPEVICDVNKIREFLVQSSKSIIFGLTN